MNKSTPLSDLPSMKKQNGPAYEEKENQIVSEILSEIDNSQDKKNVNMEINESEMQQQQQQMEMQQAQMMEQQRMLQQQELSNKRMEESLDNTLKEDNFVNNIIEMVKQPGIVAVVVALVSLPQINTMLTKIISGRENLVKYTTAIILLVKALLGGGLYFGINRSIV